MYLAKQSLQNPFRKKLWTLGRILAVLWLAFAVVSHRFYYGTNFVERPFGTLGIIVAVAFGIYLYAVFYFHGDRGKGIRGRDIFLIAILIRLPLLLFSNPVQEIDYYRYLWDGRSSVAGVSPFQFSPDDLDQLRIKSVQNPQQIPEDAQTLFSIQDRSPAWKTIFTRIDHRHVPTIYPIVSQAVFAAAALVTPDAASVFAHIAVLRGLITCFDLGIVVLLILILRKMNLPVGRAIIYAWCPLALKEFANASHMDSIAVFFTVAAFYALICARSSSEEPQPAFRGWVAASCLLLAIFAKWYPLVIVPVFVIHSWRFWGWRGSVPYLPPLLILSAGSYLISLDGASKTAPPPPQAEYVSSVDSAELGDHDDLKGLRTFLTEWEINDLIFSVVRENLRVKPVMLAEDSPISCWYAVSPNGIRKFWAEVVAKLNASALFQGSLPTSDFLGAQLFCGGILFLIIAWLSIQKTGEWGIGRAIFLILAAGWYLSATQNPWYWLWALPFLIFVRSKVWLVVSGVTFLYYARFWLIYHYPVKAIGNLSGVRLFDDYFAWVQHLPILLILAYGAWFSRRKFDFSEIK